MKSPKRGREERKLWRETGKKKREILGPTLRGPTLRGPTLRGPTLRGPPFGAHPSGPTLRGLHPLWSQNSKINIQKLAEVELAELEKKAGRSRNWPKSIALGPDPLQARLAYTRDLSTSVEARLVFVCFCVWWCVGGGGGVLVVCGGVFGRLSTRHGLREHSFVCTRHWWHVAAAIRRASSGVRLPSSDFRLTDQLCSDDLVVLGESEADLQLGHPLGKTVALLFGPVQGRRAESVFLANFSQLCRPVTTWRCLDPFPLLGRTRLTLFLVATASSRSVSRGPVLKAFLCRSLPSGYIRLSQHNVWHGICRRLRTQSCAVGPGSKTLGMTSSRLARRTPCAAVLYELALPDSLRVAMGRSLSQQLGPTGVFPFYIITR